MPRTHYDLLGVSRDASSVEIAAAFREKLADLKGKPDAAPESVEALREAYQTLANPARRDEYDHTLPAPRPTRAPKAQKADPSAVDDHDRESFWFTPKGVTVIVAAVLVVGFFGWKSRHKAPEAQIVNVTRYEPPPKGPESGEAPAAGTALSGPSSAPASPAAVGAPGAAISAEDLFASVAPSIVRVFALDGSGNSFSQGSGVVTDPNRVITNCHVVKGAKGVKVKAGNEEYEAKVATSDEELDLCSLTVPRLDAAQVAIGTAASLRTGQRVYAIGAPMGLELTLSEGIVSSLREVNNGRVIQTTAPVSPGSSGGGLFTADGTLVGIVTFQHKYGQNLNFAVPADWINEMRTRTSSKSVQTASVTASRDPTTAEMVVGAWHCFGSLSGRNGEYTFGDDGMLAVVSNDGRNFKTPYRVIGRTVQYAMGGQVFSYEIESISQSRMVQVVGGGQRLVCER